MSNLVQIDEDIDTIAPICEKVLPHSLGAKAFIQSAKNAFRHNPDLLNLEKHSLKRSIMSAAILGLRLDPTIGEAYIVPFKQNATFIPGYKGYIKLAYQKGIKVHACAVYENDEFHVAYGTNPSVHHIPALKDRGALTHTYAIAEERGYKDIVQVLTKDDINMRKPKFKSSFWNNHYDAMAKKSAIRAIAPNLPLSVQIANSIDQFYDDGKPAYVNLNDAGDIFIDKPPKEQEIKESNSLLDALQG
jgi:recombination protein RecT